MPEQFPAISGVEDASQVRVMLLQSGKQVHAPVLGIGLQPLDAGLTDIAGLAVTDGNIIVGNGTNWVAESGATARASLGLGSAATQELTPWVAYTPTFGGFGTVASISIWSKRIGDTLHIRGKFTTGTVAASEARMTLGFNGTNANVTSDATKVASIQLAGKAALGTSGATNDPVVLIESNIGYVTFGEAIGTQAHLTKLNGNQFVGSTAVVSVMAEIPITGW